MARDLGDPPIAAERYGWKNHYLSLLRTSGYRVPAGVALAVDEQFEPSDVAPLVVDGTGLDLAVRSSALAEDSAEQSFAGSFISHLDMTSTAAVAAAVADIRRDCPVGTMGVVLQQMVAAEVAGVAFSIDPVTYDLSTAAVSWVRGAGAGLVSGTATGHDVLLDKVSGALVRGDWPYQNDYLTTLIDALEALAQRLGGPVDIEWCIERGTGDLYLLQVRPVVLPKAQIFALSEPEAFERLPAVVAGHPKIQLRRKAKNAGVTMTPAQLTIANARETPEPVARILSASAAGSSVVLLQPFAVGKRIVREFAGVDTSDVEFWLSECRRYSIRQYPAFDGISATEQRVVGIGLENAALTVVLEQEIWDAHLTGIVRRLTDGYLLEVALGHFVPKGYVETSTYLVDRSLEITSRHESIQTSAYHFRNGHVVREESPEDKPNLEAETVRRILRAMMPLLDSDPHLALEFGVTELGAEGTVYLIDAAESDEPGVDMALETFRPGVVSHGRAAGVVVDLRQRYDAVDLNAHFYQSVEGESPGGPVVFIATRASVDLLPLLYACPAGSGFLFEDASLLAHFAVVMRERGVPGAVLSSEELDAVAATSHASFDTRQSPVVTSLDRES